MAATDSTTAGNIRTNRVWPARKSRAPIACLHAGPAQHGTLLLASIQHAAPSRLPRSPSTITVRPADGRSSPRRTQRTGAPKNPAAPVGVQALASLVLGGVDGNRAQRAFTP